MHASIFLPTNTSAGGELQAVSETYKTTARNTNDALALAIYIQDEIQIDNTVLNLGFRYEVIETSKTIYGKLTGIKESENSLIQLIFLPDIGVYLQFSEEFAVLAGVKPYGFRPGKSRSVNMAAKYQF
jgi:Fe(3+) dicitrate transport protein